MAILAFALFDLAVTTLAAPGGCAIRGSKAELGVRIDAGEGIAPFTVVENAQPYAIRPSEKSAKRQPIEVDGLLRFRGTVGEIEMAVASPVDLLNGMVHLAPGAQVGEPRARGKDAVSTVTLEDEVKLEDLAVPCDALTADAVGRDAKETQERELGEERELVGPRVTFRAGPGSGDSVVLHILKQRTVIVRQNTRDGRWAQVTYRSWTGSSVQGWIPASHLRSLGGISLSGIGSSSHCCGGRMVGYGNNTYRGPATVEKSTTVYGAPGKGPWATVTRTDTVQVQWDRGEPWARITETPNVSEGCGELEHAWVPIERLQIPGN
jgi:hypothetical protein